MIDSNPKHLETILQQKLELKNDIHINQEILKINRKQY
jgi:hypothetical protein